MTSVIMNKLLPIRATVVASVATLLRSRCVCSLCYELVSCLYIVQECEHSLTERRRERERERERGWKRQCEWETDRRYRRTCVAHIRLYMCLIMLSSKQCSHTQTDRQTDRYSWDSNATYSTARRDLWPHYVTTRIW